MPQQHPHLLLTHAAVLRAAARSPLQSAGDVSELVVSGVHQPVTPSGWMRRTLTEGCRDARQPWTGALCSQSAPNLRGNTVEARYRWFR